MLGVPLISTVLFTAGSLFHTAHAAGIDPAVDSALREFYSRTTGALTWVRRDGWLLSENYCTWYGIKCDGDGLVRKVVLRDNGLSTGIPDALFQISTLEHLDLSGNLLAGSIPESVCGLAGLKYLVLERNYLEGGVPECLCADTEKRTGSALRYVFVGGNALQSIPRCLRSLPNIVEVRAACNNITAESAHWAGSDGNCDDSTTLELYDLGCNDFMDDEILNNCAVWGGGSKSNAIYRATTWGAEECSTGCPASGPCPAVIDQGLCGQLVPEPIHGDD